jgi:hypothetical protein
MDDGVGYQFVVTLSEAIERTTAAWTREDPTAFRYRGAELRHAVERALYIALVNNESLRGAYSAGLEADSVHGLGSALEASVARALLTPSGGGSGRATWRRMGARAAWHGRRLAEVRSPPEGGSPGGPVAFVLGHPKLLRFVEPVRQRLLERGALVFATTPNIGEGVVGSEQVDLSQAAVRPPAGRAVGVGLLGVTPLLGLYDGLLTSFAQHQPRCVVVVEGMSSTDEVANRAAAALGIPCVCLQQGWSPFVHVGFRNMSFAAMAVWGEGFAELLRPHNPRQRFVPTGSFALAPEVVLGREELSGMLAGRPAIAFFLQPRSPLIGSAEQAALLELISRSCRRLPGCAVLVREHPASPLAQGVRDALTAQGATPVGGERFALRAILEAAAVAVSIYSTSLLEAAALGSIPVVFNPTSMPHYVPDLEALGTGVELSDVGGAEEAIADLVENAAARDRFREGGERFRRRFFADHASPADRVVELVDELAATDRTTSRGAR